MIAAALELARRKARRATVRDVVLRFFEPAPQGEKVRRSAVVNAVAKAMALETVRSEFFREVTEAVRTTGARGSRRGNVFWFRGLRPRPAPPAIVKREIPDKRALPSLQREWYARLAADGFRDLEPLQNGSTDGLLRHGESLDPSRIGDAAFVGGRVSSKRSAVDLTRYEAEVAAAAGRHDVVTAAIGFERDIWIRHCAGWSAPTIAAEMQCPLRAVRGVLSRLLKFSGQPVSEAARRAGLASALRRWNYTVDKKEVGEDGE